MPKIESITLSDDDKALYIGVSTLSQYGASLDKVKKSLRKVKKDIDHPDNATALLEAKSHLEETLKHLAKWQQLKCDNE